MKLVGVDERSSQLQSITVLSAAVIIVLTLGLNRLRSLLILDQIRAEKEERMHQVIYQHLFFHLQCHQMGAFLIPVQQEPHAVNQKGLPAAVVFPTVLPLAAAGVLLLRA